MRSPVWVPQIVIAVMALGVGHGWAQNTFDSYVSPYVRTGNFSGSVLIEKDGKRLFEKSYGFQDREKKLPNTVETRFHGASVSMQFTAAAILRLVDQGSLSQGTHVSQVVPGVTGGDQITIRDLLMERSGLADINDLPEYADILQQHQSPASLVAKVSGRPLLFEPGTKFLHEEHSAYNLLALIVEKKAGLPFAAAMEKLVFRPAGLPRTAIDDDSVAQAAKGYEPEGVDGLRPATSIHWSAKAGNASVVTTARDQARWVSALFGEQLLKKASRDAILDTAERVGYGWFRGVSSRFQQTTYSMNGRAPGFASFVLYVPREKLTVVVLSNIYSSATTTIGNDLAAISLGLPYDTFQPSEKRLTAEETRKSTGEFQFGADFYQANAVVAVIADGGDLALGWPSGGVSPLIPLGQDRFMDRSYWEVVTLERDAGGLPKGLRYDKFRGEALRSK